MFVYLIKQTQESENYQEKTIAVLTNYKQAKQVCEDLNLEYGDGDTHYYEIEKIKLNDEYWSKNKYQKDLNIYY